MRAFYVRYDPVQRAPTLVLLCEPEAIFLMLVVCMHVGALYSDMPKNEDCTVTKRCQKQKPLPI